MDSMDTLQELAHFLKKQKSNFTTASDQEYLQAIKKVLTREYSEPSSKFIHFFVEQVYSGTQTDTAVHKFTPLVKEAFRQFVNERLLECIEAAGNMPKREEADGTVVADNRDMERPGYHTQPSDEEWEDFFIVNIT